MAEILQTIAAATKIRVDKLKEKNIDVKGLALENIKEKPFYFEDRLKGDGVSFICEVKKASPSKGIIAVDFPFEEIGREYEAAGADAMSILTEPDFFKGSDEYLKAVRSQTSIPIIRKDFTIDEYQIYEARLIGADAVLLICALLDDETLKRFIKISDSVGLSALVEAHDEKEVHSALKAGARMIGVNNRNLKDFTVDVSNSLKLRDLVPKDILFVSESGIKTRDDIMRLEEKSVNAVLIGETFMRSNDKSHMLRVLKGIDDEN